MDKAKQLLENTEVQISISGHRHFGATIGTQEFIEAYAERKIKKWTNEMKYHNAIARIHPHAAYTTFVHGVIGRRLYLMRTLDVDSSIFRPLEDTIQMQFIPL